MENSSIPQFPEPYWRENSKIPSFDKLNESVKTDVGIVGGGITGITSAYLLSRQGLQVTLIDAGVLVNGTTGHTTAKITAQHGLVYDELINHFGAEKATLYYQAAEEAKQFIETTVKGLGINCDFQKEDAYIYTNEDNFIKQLELEKKAYDQLSISGELTNSIPLDLPVKAALIMKEQAQFHPIKYLKALVKECVKNGVKFYENTTAVDIEYNKHPSIVMRDGNRVTCRYVIAASHFPFYDKESFYFSRMYPERSYLIAIKADHNFPGGMYINAESPTRSIRATEHNGKKLWLIGGENHKTGQGIPTMEHYKALYNFAENHFTVKDYLYRWSAQDLTTLDKVPYIGRITKNEDAVFIATGFRKWGMTNGTISGKIICDQILNKENVYSELFSPSRFQADPSVRKFIKMNTDVAKHLVKGKLEYTNSDVSKLEPDNAMVARIKGNRTGVYKDKENEFHMVDTTCTHLGCEVEWNSGDRTWDCPCHGSRFSYTGDVIEGPAKKPLKKIEDHS
ncbi:FAD-dependent oxidoreductase [Virgibacillus halodenitrificans]|uniref:FAD-dependent oxidoreductase n=1 Tax=Virgibacillus halodenitrificans TaxID=1482 RepID=UPI000EF532CE|nr:FAD-dependent oxidoreductase [Virgibacillus halodenitrificans]